MNALMQCQLESRRVWVDWLRLFAFFLVVLCHCCDPFTFNPNAAPSPAEGFWGALWQCSSRACVPLFACMTGVLLLPTLDRLLTCWRKRIGRVLWPFLIWSALYCCFPVVYIGVLGYEPEGVFDWFVSAQEPSGELSAALGDFAGVLLNFSSYSVHMWYVYLIIGLYLFLPILSAWVERATLVEKYAVLGLWGVTLFFPYTDLAKMELFGVCAWNGFGMLHYFAGFSGYLLLGHLAAQWKPMGLPKAFCLALPLLVVGYLVTLAGFRVVQTGAYAQASGWSEMLGIAMSPQTPSAPYIPEHEIFLLFCSPHVALMVLGFLILFRQFGSAPLRVRALLANFTACGFGIYLVHYFFVGPSNMLMRSLGVPMELVIPSSAVVALLVTWAVVALLRRLVPGKWFLG